MAMPRIEFPWNRKKTTRVAGIELPHIELPKLDPKSIERARTQLSRDTGRLAETSAATIGAVAGQAAEKAGQAAERAGQLGQEAGKLGRELATGGEANLRALGADLKELSREVGSLRVTRQKQRPDTMPGIALLAGLGAGLAAMFFFDPEQGRRRRALLRDQLVKWSRVTSETISGRAEDLRNRSIGLAHEARKAVEGGAERASEAAESVVDTTPEAAPQLAATDTAAGISSEASAGAGTGGEGASAGVYSTSEYDPSLTGEGGTEPSTTENEQLYGSLTDTVRDAWGSGERTDENRSETH